MSAAKKAVKSTLGHGSKNKVFVTKDDIKSLVAVDRLRDELKKKGGVSAILADEIGENLAPYRIKNIID